MAKQKKDARGSKIPLTVGRSELLVKGSDNQFRELVHNALAFATRLEAVRDQFARYIGLTGVQYTIMISVAHLRLEDDVGISQVAKHLSLSSTFVTTEVRKMVSKKLLTKEVSSEDRRRVCLQLTSKAEELLTELSEIQPSVNDIHFEPINRDNLIPVTKLMKDLTLSTDRALVLLEHYIRLKDVG